MYWSQAATDPWFNAIDESYGNGLKVISGFSPITGLIDYRQSGTGGSTTNVQNLGYTWDKAQNLTQRQDSRQGLTEAFYYDALNRLDYSTLNGTTNLDVTLDLIGNVTYRSDVGSYTYHATKKHAVTAAGGNTYTYDNNGNVATRNGVAIVWSSYNLPLTINGNGQTAQLAYAPDRSRWRQISSYAGGSETTIYVGEALEKMTASASNIVRWRHLIPTPGANVQVTRRSDGTNEVLYVAKDHLGSTDALLNASGTVLARASFAAYGGRRGSAWSGAPTTAEMQAYADQTRRGYTEHEMLDNVGLIHMNGRVYDPGVGRFMSADPIADGLGEAGGFNRYAYVSNRPLSLTDPSGFSGNNQCKIAGCKPEDAPMMAEITSSSSAKTFNHPNWQMIDIASRIADAFTNVQVVSDSEGTEVEVRGRRSEHDADAARRWLEDLRRRVSTAGWYVREYRCVAVEWGSSTAAGAAGGAAFAFVTGNIPAIAQATLIGGAVGFAASATPSGAGDFFAGMLGSMAVRARSGYSRGDQFAEIIGDGVGALASGPLATIGVGSGIGASLAAVRPVQNLPPLTGAMPAYARMLPGALAGSASATVALAVMALGDSVAERLGCP